MLRIDMLGAPGCGKSTVYARMLASRAAPNPLAWLTPGEARRQIVAEQFRTRKLRSRLVWLFLTRSRQYADIATHLHAQMLAKQAIANAPSHWEPFFGICLSVITEIGKPPIETMEWLRQLYQAAYDAALVQASELAGVALFDESLTHRAFGLISAPNSNAAGLRAFERIPAPDAVLHCYAPADTIVRRVAERQQRTGKIIPAHIGLSPDELYERIEVACNAADRIAAVYRARGIRILSIDTTRTPDENIPAINALIHEVGDAERRRAPN